MTDVHPSSVGRAASPTPAMSVAVTPSLSVRGAAVVYRLYDAGYEIHLERLAELLAERAPASIRPVRGEAQAIQISVPPVTLALGQEQLVVAGRRLDVEVSARVFAFGVVSLRLRVPAPRAMSWDEFTAFGLEVQEADTVALFEQHLERLVQRLRGATERPDVAPITEDYIVFRIEALAGGAPGLSVSEALRDVDVVPLLLNETRPLSSVARRELLPHRFSYYADDLAILTWDNALVVDPVAEDETDVEYILEFANAQLLELRYYDALLDAELPRMYDRVAQARQGHNRLRRRFTPLLAQLQTLVADSTEIVERAENALKVTDDVYLARVYSAALEIFRARVWRTGIDRKLAIIRETYAMLNAESQAARSEILEVAIVVLIVLEIALALVMK